MEWTPVLGRRFPFIRLNPLYLLVFGRAEEAAASVGLK